MIHPIRALHGLTAYHRPTQVDVRVDGRYLPDRIEAVAGAPLRLVFDRRETGACSREVVFPDLGLTARLVPYAQTMVELTPERPGELAFHCGKNRLHGTVVVAPVTSPPALPPRGWRRDVGASPLPDPRIFPRIPWP